METVKVYHMEEREVPYAPSVEFHDYIGAGDFKNWRPYEEGMIRTESHPVREYHWSNGKRILAVLSPELREIIDIEVGEIESLKGQLRDLDKELSKAYKEDSEFRNLLRTMSFWQRLKFLFKGEMCE